MYANSLIVNARIAVVEPDYADRSALSEALLAHGFRSIHQIESRFELEHFADKGIADLFICDADMANGMCLDFMHAVRRSKKGRNPFALSLMTTESPDQSKLQDIMQVGADGLLRKPVIRERAFSYVSRMIHERAPFIVAGDYIGPERRALRRLDADTQRFKVPNSLRERVNGTYDPVAMENKIQDFSRRIEANRAKENIMLIADLVRETLLSHKRTKDHTSFCRGFREIAGLAEETEELIRRSGDAKSGNQQQTAIVCRGLRQLAELMSLGHNNSNAKAINLLTDTTEQMKNLMEQPFK